MRYHKILPGMVLLPGLLLAQTANVDFSSLQQEIDGFGASSAGTGAMTGTELDAAFSNTNQNQLGLSILRVEIDAAGQSAWGPEQSNAAGAKTRGVKYVLATPWSPPASMKSNSSPDGGQLNASSYAAYAAYLKSYRTYMGDLVDVISIQNEPNLTTAYASCSWSPTQLLTFMKNNAGDIGGSVMIPEESYFDFSYADPSLNDPTANANFTHIGLHLYGGQLQTYTNAISKGKKVWMTEHYYDPDDIGTALTAAKEIMDCLNDQMNGYVWWCLVLPNCNLINTDGSIQLKGYVMGQFSKYVRPGSNRVTATYSPQSGVTVVAFTGASNIIIAVNQNTSAKTQAFSVTKGNFTNPKRYTTSSSKKLADAGSTTVANGSFTATLDAQSITTFISDNSTGIKSAPTWIPALVQTGRKISGEGAFLQLRDFRGRVLRTAEGEGGHLEMDLSGLREGIYLATSGRNSIPVSILGR